MRDRDLRMQEVIRAYQICPVEIGEQAQSNDTDSYAEYCVGIVEAWEEYGYLYISSQLCEKGNLNDYLIQLEEALNQKHGSSKKKTDTAIFCTEESDSDIGDDFHMHSDFKDGSNRNSLVIGSRASRDSKMLADNLP